METAHSNASPECGKMSVPLCVSVAARAREKRKKESASGPGQEGQAASANRTDQATPRQRVHDNNAQKGCVRNVVLIEKAHNAA
ncbi:hypothetical protein ZHAS_00016138 [Anopheles sinensis]|uniref:Uncharacterized protein n=1 Tax=Anopheles sinensis TaxID=74873 RepID=A0A084WCS7_ANOSI|nr:hypothetical protein ZHAS_00016138 [Anopheles sinensis]